MKRTLLALGASCGLVAAAGCDLTGPSFTRTCYDVPTAVQETRGDTVVTTTGLRYIEGATGEGDLAEKCTVVTVSYQGYLLDGTNFDSGQFSFIPGTAGVIRGFEQGVVGMRVGGTRHLIIPPELGYGDEPQVDPQTGEVSIPANSTIVFDVQVLQVTTE